MNVEMLKLGATYYHATRRGEIDKHHAIGVSVRVEAKLSNSGAKDIFSPDLRIKFYEDEFCGMERELIIYFFELSVEDILNPIVLFFRRCVSTN